MDVPRPHETLDDLFRRESGHLVAALVRLLGPSQVALAEDVVHDALVAALQAWRFEVPKNPKAWLLETAKNRARNDLDLHGFHLATVEACLDSPRQAS